MHTTPAIHEINRSTRGTTGVSNPRELLTSNAFEQALLDVINHRLPVGTRIECDNRQSVVNGAAYATTSGVIWVPTSDGTVALGDITSFGLEISIDARHEEPAPKIDIEKAVRVLADAAQPKAHVEEKRPLSNTEARNLLGLALERDNDGGLAASPELSAHEQGLDLKSEEAFDKLAAQVEDYIVEDVETLGQEVRDMVARHRDTIGELHREKAALSHAYKKHIAIEQAVNAELRKELNKAHCTADHYKGMADELGIEINALKTQLARCQSEQTISKESLDKLARVYADNLLEHLLNKHGNGKAVMRVAIVGHEIAGNDGSLLLQTLNGKSFTVPMPDVLLKAAADGHLTQRAATLLIRLDPVDVVHNPSGEA